MLCVINNVVFCNYDGNFVKVVRYGRDGCIYYVKVGVERCNVNVYRVVVFFNKFNKFLMYIFMGFEGVYLFVFNSILCKIVVYLFKFGD